MVRDDVIDYLEENKISVSNLDKVYEQVIHDHRTNDMLRPIIGDLAYYKKQLTLIRVEKTILLVKKNL